MAAIQAHESHNPDHSRATYGQCKAISRSIKLQDTTDSEPPMSLKELVPTRAVSDHLIHTYLRTFQTMLGIIVVPSFRQDYHAFWEGLRDADEAFGVSLLLVMCTGSTFSSTEACPSKLTIQRWMNVATSWLISASKHKAKLTLDGLRIQCLYLLACQSTSIKGDITSLSTGTLLRSAMHAGIHIDNEQQVFPDISPSLVQSRRTLWASILELELQSSMDCGSLPLVDSSDYNCALPSNLNDMSLDPGDHSWFPSQPKPIDHLTESSFQILLAKTIPIRLKIAKSINGFSPGSSYETVLSLSAELSKVLQECYSLIEGYKISSTPPSAFQTKLFDLLVQRFILSLHHPFAIKAISEPSYFYSRRLCLGTSLTLFSSSSEDFHPLLVHGSYLFRDVLTQAALYMCGELVNESEVAQPFPSNPISLFAYKELRKAVDKYLELSVERLNAEERSIKRFVLVSCLSAQADAIQAGANI